MKSITSLTETIDEVEFSTFEEELSALFVSEEPAIDAADAEETSERVDQILKRARAETVVSDTTAFVFESFGRGLSGITDAVFSAIEKHPPKKDSF